MSQQGTTFLQSRIVLDNDLDMGAHYWTPIKKFGGFFDGNGHTLSGVQVQAGVGIPALSPLYKAIMAIPNMEWCMT